jgi:carbamate kinase
MGKRAVVAVGGNALIRPGQKGSVQEQLANAEEACSNLLPVIEQGFQLLFTHGNGPQVGNRLLRVEISSDEVQPLPLDVCVADTQGGMGFMLQQAMDNVLRAKGITRPVGTVVTQVIVDANDPAFDEPSKPIGSFYTGERAKVLRREKGWRLVEQTGRGYRRVVPSPIPQKIVELEVIRTLVDAGVVVIAAGGGGVPVVLLDGILRGVEAVIDKDRASSLIAQELKADLFLIATNVERVFLDYGRPGAKALSEISVEEAETHLKEGQFPPGSMGPKIEAALDYLRAGGREVVIADMSSVESALRGETGTRIYPST